MYKLITHSAVGLDCHRASLLNGDVTVYMCHSPWTMGTYRVSRGILRGNIDLGRLLSLYPSATDTSQEAQDLQVFFHYLREALEGIVEGKEGWLRTVEAHKFPGGVVPIPTSEERVRGLDALSLLRTMPDLAASLGVWKMEGILFMVD